MPAFIRGASLKGVTAVENSFITDYMPGADGEYVKVYLYGLMRCFEPASEAECPFDEETLFAAGRVIERAAGMDFSPTKWW